jgi:hypothetical protein
LFSSEDEPLVLSRVAEEAANHEGNLWTPIISLRREDAARLGFDRAGRWRDFLRSYAPELAAALKISPERFRWYAAFHDEGEHPHVHMVCWSSEPQEGFLTKEGIRRIRSALTTRIFRDDLLHVYERQTEYRSELGEAAKSRMSELIAAMQDGELRSDELERLVLQLSRRLSTLKGKKQYGYLPPSVKAIVDAIADELCKDGRVAECYRLWCEAKRDVWRTYRDEPPEPAPLSKQPELKRIRNIIIEAAAKLNIELQATDAQNRQPTFVGTQLLWALGDLFRENPAIPKHSSATERKRLQKMRRKKIALGHAEDEREQRQSY